MNITMISKAWIKDPLVVGCPAMDDPGTRIIIFSTNTSLLTNKIVTNNNIAILICAFLTKSPANIDKSSGGDLSLSSFLIMDSESDILNCFTMIP